MPILPENIVPEVLEQTELNLGQSAPVDSLNFVPEFKTETSPGSNVFTTTPPAASTKKGAGQEMRILEFQGSSKKSRQITIALSAFLEQAVGAITEVGIPGGGPIVARIEFGSGSAFSFVEVDVPLGLLTSLSDLNNPRTQNGVILSLPGSSFLVTVRNDAALFPIDMFGAATSVQRTLGGGSTGQTGSASRVRVSAHAAYNSRPGHEAGAGAVRRRIALAIAAQLTGQYFRVPPFSKSLRILRTNLATIGVEVRFVCSDNGLEMEQITIPAGIQCPTIPIPTDCSTIIVITTGAANIYADFAIEA